MSESLLGVIITCIVTLIGIFVTSKTTRDKITSDMAIKQAVTDTKIDSLTTEIRESNELTKRVPLIEERIKAIDERLKKLEMR